ncbi:MAG: amino-acid N-acetyltransferase [Planctomycetia bacterium]|nr:amino-acid N-acetyltransferase [Planctomycetia bacterium]
MRLTIYREILPYVPRFKDKLFVIALDGAVVEDDNFRNLLRDIALLRSLSIKVALVHGATHQIRRLASAMNITPTNLDGSGVTDTDTLRLALLASARVSWELLEGLSAADLRGAVSNALVAHPAGILQGIDHQHTGKVERIDTSMLQALLEREIIPVVPPIGCDGEGHSFRLNSDVVAVEVARAMGAVKVIYLTIHAGLPIPGEPGEVYRQLKEGEAEHVFKRHAADYPPELRSKLEQAIKAVRGGVPRVHVIDGRVEEGLLGEVFSNEGIGTLIHTNEYQEIRSATRRDLRAIYTLIQGGVERDELVRRPRSELERHIDDYFVFELDKMPAGCAALHVYPDEEMGELAAVCVDPRFENRGIGGKLMRYVEDRARAKGLKTLFCLSTQAFNYFQQKGGFTPGTPDDLPPARRERYDKSGRRSMVLLKRLG